MIHYQLLCRADHAFDGWFKDSASFDRQAEQGLVSCPFCDSAEIRRALMAPAVGRGTASKRDKAGQGAPAPDAPKNDAPAVSPAMGALAAPAMPDEMKALLQRLRSEVEKHCDYVGADFAEEARRIHYGETKAHGIYGKTTPSEAKSLADEGIEFGVLPWLNQYDG